MEPIGSVWGPEYGERTRTAYVLHMLDEFVHHGAEVALLRDLWRWQRAVADDPVVEQVIRGDLAVLDEVDGGRASSDLLERAAAYGRWALVVGLVERGAPISTTGRTALHLAAGAGELAAVRALLDGGADRSARDPEFHATPRQWAEFLGHPEVVDFLDAEA